MRIAALITCHNRKAQTLACLEALYQNTLPDGYSLDVFLVDDGSIDGTEQAVRERYPQVNVIKGDGSLYWNGGMRVAFAAAMEKDFDYYLWLNDDTQLYPNVLDALISTHERLSKEDRAPLIIVGSTQDIDVAKLTYGGMHRVSKWLPLRMGKVMPQKEAVQCDTMNGNCVLLSRVVVKLVGNLDRSYTHSMGDIDYGFRARKLGCKIWVVPGFVGKCDLNTGKGMWADVRLPLQERWKRMLGPKGLPPKEWLAFTHRHGGWLWPVLWANPYVKFWIKGLSRF